MEFSCMIFTNFPAAIKEPQRHFRNKYQTEQCTAIFIHVEHYFVKNLQLSRDLDQGPTATKEMICANIKQLSKYQHCAVCIYLQKLVQ